MGHTESHLAIYYENIASNDRTALHSIKLLAEEVPWKSSNNQGYC